MDNPLNCLANELELGRPFKKILSFEVYDGPFNKIEVLKEFETGISGQLETSILKLTINNYNITKKVYHNYNNQA